MRWGFSHGRFAEICEHLVHKGGDAERLASVSAWRLTCLGTARAAPHAATVDSACLGRWSSLAGGSCSWGRHPKAGTWYLGTYPGQDDEEPPRRPRLLVTETVNPPAILDGRYCPRHSLSFYNIIDVRFAVGMPSMPLHR